MLCSVFGLCAVPAVGLLWGGLFGFSWVSKACRQLARQIPAVEDGEVVSAVYPFAGLVLLFLG